MQYSPLLAIVWFILYKFKLWSAWGMGAVLVVYSPESSIYANGCPLGVRRRGSRSSHGRYWHRRYSAGRLGGWELTAVGHRVLLVQIKVNMGEGWWCTHKSPWAAHLMFANVAVGPVVVATDIGDALLKDVGG